MTERLYLWVRVSGTVWEHEPSGTKLLWTGDEWVVRFPSTKAVPWTVDDADEMYYIIASSVAFRPADAVACNASPGTAPIALPAQRL